MEITMQITDLLPMSWRPYAKAIVTFLVIFLTATAAVVADGVTLAEWLGVAATVLTGTGAAYGTRNDPYA